jgi:hypothetical protein
MTPSRRHRALLPLATATAAAALLSLVVLVPRTSIAFDASANLGTMDGTRCDDVAVTTHIERRDGRWVVAIQGDNSGPLPQTCVFQAAMERWWNSADIRTPSEVTTLYTQPESITVPPHAQATVVRDVPAWLGQQLDTADRIQKAREAADAARCEQQDAPGAIAVLSVPWPDFQVAVREPHAETPRVRLAGGMMPASPPPPAPPHVRDRDGDGMRRVAVSASP